MGKNGNSNRSHSFIPAVDMRSITLGGPAGNIVGMSRLRSPSHHPGRTEAHALEDAFMLSVQLRDYSGDIYHHGRLLPFKRQAAGEMMFYDYRDEWQAELRSAFDCVNFHIPRSVLNAAISEERRTTLEGLRYRPGIAQSDPVVMALVQALLPSLDLGHQRNGLFVDHVGLALSAHVAKTYGDLIVFRSPSKGGLAPWQERRAKELIEDRLATGVSLAELASECGLSTSHFARAFRKTTGTAPYQWLLARRLEKAERDLKESPLSIAEVAFLNGFSDKSHFSKVFARAHGVPPAAWRRRYAA